MEYINNNVPRCRYMTPDRAMWYVELLKEREGNRGNAHDALIVAEKALQRVMPTQVTHQSTIYECNTCPNCLNVVDEKVEFVPGQITHGKPNYCKFCGQALLWE